MAPSGKHIAFLSHETHRGEGKGFAELITRDFTENLAADLPATAEVGNVEVGADAGTKEATGGNR